MKIETITSKGLQSDKNPVETVLQKHLQQSAVSRIGAAKLAFVMHIVLADLKIDAAEKVALRRLIATYFNITDDKIEPILNDILEIPAHDLQLHYLSEILKAEASKAERIQFLDDLFMVAYCDGDYAPVEERDIRFICQYFHIEQPDFIAARTKAKELYES